MTIHERLAGGVRRHLAVTVAAVVVAGAMAFAGGALAGASANTAKPAPWPSASQKYFLYVDTDAAATEGIYGDCQQGSVFPQGSQVLFRVAGTYDGKALTTTNTRLIEVILPGVSKPLQMAYAAHTYGVKKGATPPEYWTVAWTVPKTYTLGVVNFRIHVQSVATGSKGFAFSWTQIPISSSDLTITAAS